MTPNSGSPEIFVHALGEADLDAMSRIVKDAFAEQGPTIARLSLDLLADPTARPAFGLIAETEGEAVGCVIFSAVGISGHDLIKASILAPLAVVTHRQRKGIGRRLVEAGLAILRDRKTDLVFVLGDPAYYGRFGFAAGHEVSAPYDLPYPEAWMILRLEPATRAEGRLTCAQTLMVAEHW